MVHFVPLLKGKKFTGKYLIKIIVQQGEPTSVYCFSQKIQLQGADKKTDDYEIMYAYKRLNMGNIK